MTKRCTILVTASLATLLALFAPALVARADIFQWEYINPANPPLGKQQSTMLAPGGAGANGVPGADLGGRNLTMAYLIGADLTGAYVSGVNLTNAELSQANLTNAYLWGATLTGAYLAGAEVRGASFDLTGITAAQLYSTANYQSHDLTGVGLRQVNLTGWNLAGQILTNANFRGAVLTGANLSGAEVRGARFSQAGISIAQLYSTASYQAHDLTGIDLESANLTAANFAGQKLTNAGFINTTLTGANLSGAEVRGANFLRGFPYTAGGISFVQLYSTASYQAHDLIGIQLDGNDLTGGNFAGQNLTNAGFGASANLTNADLSQANLSNAVFTARYNDAGSANLSGANLSHAKITNADFSGTSTPIYDEWGEYQYDYVHPGAYLGGANLSGADARGASFYLATLTGANTSNLIQSDGHIAGLGLTAGASLVVRDYEGNPAASSGPLPIVVDQHLAMDTTGTLRLVFDADLWDSTISFAPGIPVALGGTLELLFAPDVSLASQFGRTIDLFDWTGVSPSGAFSVSSSYTWNLSKLYTTGEVKLTSSIAGDVNLDGAVNIFDVNEVSTHWKTAGPHGDANLDGAVNIFDINLISSNWGVTGGSATAVPEPSTSVLITMSLVGVVALGWRRRR